MSRCAGVLTVALGVALSGVISAAPVSMASADAARGRYHYSIRARVRPLLVFWIGRDGVGDALVTRRQAVGEADYSLLIGTDPDRAPRRINRWGYISEEVRGAHARLVGLMTESDEETIEQAEANLRKQAGDRAFKIIRATVDRDEATSLVTSLAAPARYSVREASAVLALAERQASGESGAKTRTIRLPSGTRPGFLTAVAELMHEQAGEWRASGRIRPGQIVTYVYHGRIYELRATRAQPANVRIGSASSVRAIASDFQVTSLYDGEVTRFSLTFGAEGAFNEVPLAASYQPRWWLQIELTLDESTGVDR